VPQHPNGIGQADGGDFTVIITRPAEGETYYAGPTTLMYSVPVMGRVTGEIRIPEEIEVLLEIIQNGDLQTVANTHLTAEGTFSFLANVNPEASEGWFPEDMKDCTDECHTPGNIDLPAGSVTLRVTAKDSVGRVAIDERHIIVDRSHYATVPVQVIRLDNPRGSITNIPVSASTRLYMWRTRYVTDKTDDTGIAHLQVEALAESPTHYIFWVEPTVVDGVLYTGDRSIEVTLPAGVRSFPQLKLTVYGQTGQITGSILGIEEYSLEPITIAAIQVPEGMAYKAHAAVDGTFSIAELPIDQYLVTVDFYSSNQSLNVIAQEVDLTTSIQENVQIPLQFLEGHSISGIIQDENNNSIPFAWVTVEEDGKVQKIFPQEGTFKLDGVTPAPTLLKFDAPGYYSHYQEVDLSPGSVSHIRVTLKVQPGTRSFSWGNGVVNIPPETNAIINDEKIILKQGWLWGQNNTTSLITIVTNDAEIQLSYGHFALEYLHNQSGWLYMLSGTAKIRIDSSQEPIIVPEKYMVNLQNDEGFKPVPIDTIVMQTLHSQTLSPILSVWEPSAIARIREWATRIGVGAAQLITTVVYSIVLLPIVLIPLYLFLQWWKKKCSE